MTDTVKRGPGRPPKVTEPVESVTVSTQEPATVAVYDTNIPQLVPVVDRKLVFLSGYLSWQPLEAKVGFAAPIAYGWSDGLVTWGTERA